MTPTSYLHGDLLDERFQALDRFLITHQALWRPRPFTEPTLAWEDEHPALAASLRRCSLEDAEQALDPTTLPMPFPALAEQALYLADVGLLPQGELAAAGPRQSTGVPGRKWAQIEAFGRCLTYARTPEHWLDWCAGKGHLGRRLLQPGQRLTCLEYDATLVDVGQALSDHHHLPARHLRQDVMAADCSNRLKDQPSPVALHACGDLHVRLLHLASQRGCPQIAVAPCCYNRIAGEQYTPLSQAARASSLHLSLDDLGLPLSEAVTAGARTRRQRDLSMARRLGFDRLQRQQRGVDDYLPTPSLPVAWLEKPFETYCRDLAQLKGVLVQGPVAWAALETHGWQRLAQVRNLERVRNLFRRPLELWLVLDRALYLREQAYDVRVGVFCDYALTPRNLLMLAEQPVDKSVHKPVIKGA
ncbi:methyltransferase [Pseudomonas monteilii]|jgi:hypothetical protein